MRHHSEEENARMLRTAREYLGHGVCAADLAGAESLYPMSEFMELFKKTKALGMPFTLHAGECGSVQNILDSVETGAGRIGHGIAMRGYADVQKGLQKNMKILIDTNVILDVLCDRTDFVESSSKIWKLCEIEKIDGYISALSIPNIVYILRKELTPEKTQQIIEQLFMIFHIADLKSSDIRKAANMKTSDYEDAIQMVCAQRMLSLIHI